MSEYVYGKNSFVEALKSNRIVSAYLLDTSEFLKEVKAKRIPYKIVTRKELDKMSKSGNHQGCLAEVKEFKFSSVAEMVANAPEGRGLIVILDGLKDPHNLGAIVRSCEAAGVDGLIYKKHNSVKVNDTVAKVACGALEYVRIAEVTHIVNTIKELKKSGYWVVGTDGSAKQMYTDLKYDMNTVLIIGSEGEGMSRLAKEECDFMVKLPMLGHVNSLNASVAAGICIYNVLATRNRV